MKPREAVRAERCDWIQEGYGLGIFQWQLGMGMETARLIGFIMEWRCRWLDQRHACSQRQSSSTAVDLVVYMHSTIRVYPPLQYVVRYGKSM